MKIVSDIIGETVLGIVSWPNEYYFSNIIWYSLNIFKVL